MRSKLFVPGTRPELFAKALASAADAISIDLEDAVAETRKAEAREAARAFLTSTLPLASRKQIIVRVNAIDSPHFEADLEAVITPAVTLINLPKPESVDDVLAAVTALEKREAAMGIMQPIGLLLNIETPRALRLASSLAAAHPRVAGLQLGLGDLFEPHNVNRRDLVNVHAAMFALRMAAAEAGVYAVDGAFANVADADGFRAEAAMSQRLGFIGKSCIHPSQVAMANEIFSDVDSATLAHARRVVAAAADIKARGAVQGAFLVDGRMIDLPFLTRARAIVASADYGSAEPP